MHRARYELTPEIVLDARRAVYLRAEQTLAVADLHLGYAWAHRAHGQLLPIAHHDEAINRLAELVADYQPRRLVLLGDVVHRAVAIEPLRAEIDQLFTEIGSATELCLVAGNHDVGLHRILGRKRSAALHRELQLGPHRLLHGDLPDAMRAAELLACAESDQGYVLIGHEHPAVSVSDGVATSARVPCFAIGPCVIILPAFSAWSAGTNLRSYDFMSPLARTARINRTVAILARKLLPLPWQG